MASLSFIMDVTDDHGVGTRTPHNKRARGTDDRATAGELDETEDHSKAGTKHAISGSGPATTQQDHIKDATVVCTSPTKRRATSSRAPKSPTDNTSAAAPKSQPRLGTPIAVPASSSSLAPASSGDSSANQQSTVSDNLMDSQRYGRTTSSSASSTPSLAGGGSRRSMPVQSAVGQFTPRMTPKTRRISKAKKGLPVHVCDICQPPKIFTRAEHLRRHQLGHKEPQFQCPGCERAFHRADLLARHQQKHEHIKDGSSKGSSSAQQSSHSGPTAPSPQTRCSPQQATSPPAPGVASEMASGMGPTANSAVDDCQSAFSGHDNRPSHGDGGAYGPTASHTPSHDFHQHHQTAYTYSPTISIANSVQPSPSLGGSSYPPGGLGSYHQPRTDAPPSVYMVTEEGPTPSLLQTDVPELHDGSSLPSSSSDSTYSTPASEISRNTGPSAPGHRSPYPGATAHVFPTSSSGVDSTPSFAGPLFISSPHPAQEPQGHTYGGTLGMPSPVVGYTSSLTASSDDTTGVQRRYQQQQQEQQQRQQRQHARSLSSLRGQTPPLDCSHGAEALLAPAPPLPDHHLNATTALERRKGFMMGPSQDLSLGGGGSGGSGGLDMLGDGSAVRYAAASPGTDNTSHGSDIVAELDLALGAGYVLPGSSSMNIPLPGPVRAAIPRYLEIYWKHVDPALPLIHRPSFEAAPEDVLRCAMAAVATQRLDSKEDRMRGNQLHDVTWQELKRIPQWSLQTMQAILLCEYFARFRGRKPVTRPSKMFESLYSRAMYQNHGLQDQAMFAEEHQHFSVQEERWRNWIEAESRRRLLAICFVTDGHAAIYQQQRRAQDGDTDAAMHPIPLPGRTAKLWEATSAEEWADTLAADPDALVPVHLPPFEQLTFEDVARRPPIDRIIILSALARQLPRRPPPLPTSSLSANNSPSPELNSPPTHLQFGGQFGHNQQPPPFLRQHHYNHHHHHQQYYHAQLQPHQPGPSSFDAEERINALYPDCPVANTYLALHHTPLRDLLAVSGDSWVFSQKVLPATSFHEHQRRLKIWVTSCNTTTNSNNNNNNSSSSSSSYSGPLAGLDVVRATVYAARAIVGFLDRERHRPPHYGSSITDACAAPWATDMSDYWALYVCALICWAFVHPVHASVGGGGKGSIGADSSGRGVVEGGSSSSRCSSRCSTNGTTISTTTSNSNSNISSSSGGGSGDFYPPPPFSTVLLPSDGENAPAGGGGGGSDGSSRPRNGIRGPPPLSNNNDKDNDDEDDNDNDDNDNDDDEEEAALNWLRTVAAGAGRLEEVVRARGLPGAAGVVGLVRKRLENDCGGGWSRLYVDAVGVLGKLEDGSGWKWF
ncbi:hypothetical protein VTH82DRAFT_8508 [Thermothelomyces myriococcoides]